MKNEVMVVKDPSIFASACKISKYSALTAYEITKRNMPEIKLYAEILGEKAFMTFDFWFEILRELIPIAIICVVVFTKWAYKTPVAMAVREFLDEMRLAVAQIVIISWLSTAIFVSEIGGEMRNLWRFRKELIEEWR